MQLNFSLPTGNMTQHVLCMLAKCYPHFSEMFIPLEASGVGEDAWKKLSCNVT
jgi:hypothetical protein